MPDTSTSPDEKCVLCAKVIGADQRSTHLRTLGVFVHRECLRRELDEGD